MRNGSEVPVETGPGSSAFEPRDNGLDGPFVPVYHALKKRGKRSEVNIRWSSFYQQYVEFGIFCQPICQDGSCGTTFIQVSFDHGE